MCATATSRWRNRTISVEPRGIFYALLLAAPFWVAVALVVVTRIPDW
jgi:hypothetical protein